VNDDAHKWTPFHSSSVIAGLVPAIPIPKAVLV